MKKQILVSLLLTKLFAYAQDSQARWKTDVLVDGAATEWNKPLRFYSSDAGLFFSVANDSTYLYLCFQANNEKTQMKITGAGMKLKLKAKGVIKCDASIDFPIGMKQERMTPPEEHGTERPDIKEKRHAMMLRNVNLSAQGFATQNGTLPVKTTGGINAAIDWDEENKMTYELAIPLKELFGAHFSLKEMTKALTIGVEINALSRPEIRNAGGDGTGGAGDMAGGGMGGATGGGGMSGGGLNGGGMGGGQGRSGMDGAGGGRHPGPDADSEEPGEQGNVRLFDPSSFKQRFILAQKAGD